MTSCLQHRFNSCILCSSQLSLCFQELLGCLALWTEQETHTIPRTCVTLKIRDTFPVKGTELFNPQQRFGEYGMKLTLF